MSRIAPAKIPQMNRDQLIELIIKTYPGVNFPPIVFVGIRGYYMRTMGDPTKNDRAVYDDAIFILTNNELHAFNANCDPAHYRPGIANLKAGIWAVYKFDKHNGQYPAICQRAGKVTVIRDGKGEDTGMFGINIHRGGSNVTGSLGCQTIPPNQWDRFMGTANRLALAVYGVNYMKQVYTYVLIDN